MLTKMSKTTSDYAFLLSCFCSLISNQTLAGEGKDDCADKGVLAETKQASPNVSEQACPDDGPRLAQTGICQGRGVNYLNFTNSWEQPYTPEGCDWVLQETKIAIDDEYLLYLALRCDSVTSQLEFGVGAHMGSLTLNKSVLGLTDMKIADVHLVENNNPQKSILQRASYLAEPDQFKGCMVRQDDVVPEAYVVDVSTEEAAKAPKDEPRYACGPYGLDQSSTSYWRVFGDKIYFFQLGQDAYQDIDVDSMTLVKPDGNGSYFTVE